MIISDFSVAQQLEACRLLPNNQITKINVLVLSVVSLGKKVQDGIVQKRKHVMREMVGVDKQLPQ